MWLVRYKVLSIKRQASAPPESALHNTSRPSSKPTVAEVSITRVSVVESPAMTTSTVTVHSGLQGDSWAFAWENPRKNRATKGRRKEGVVGMPAVLRS